MSNRAEIFMTFKNWEKTEITRCQQNKQKNPTKQT